MPSRLLLAASAFAVSLAAPALAQDHTGHEEHAQAPVVEPDHAQMDHAAMDNVAMGHATPAGPIEASGTSRLPAAEGMMPGVHFDLGGGWTGMAHGYLWGIYTDQGGPRGDDKLYVASMAMLMADVLPSVSVIGSPPRDVAM